MKRIFLNNWAKVAALCVCAAVGYAGSCKPEENTPETGKGANAKPIDKGGKIQLTKAAAEALGLTYDEKGTYLELSDENIKKFKGEGAATTKLKVKLKDVNAKEEDKEYTASEIEAIVTGWAKAAGDLKTDFIALYNHLNDGTTGLLRIGFGSTAGSLKTKADVLAAMAAGDGAKFTDPGKAVVILPGLNLDNDSGVLEIDFTIATTGNVSCAPVTRKIVTVINASDAAKAKADAIK